MHPNQTFRKATDELNINFARERSFGTLAINADNGPLLSHIPFLLSKDGKNLEAHLVRSNPILKCLDSEVNAVIAVSGGDTYISTDWYELDNQVPTWNYVAVHIRGRLKRLPQDRLPGILERLSGQFETRLLPKPVWKMAKLEQETLEKMQRMIVPISMEVTSIDGTWKLAQNKPEEARLAAARQVDTGGIGREVSEIASLMRKPPC